MSTQDSNHLSHLRTKPLTGKQERRLVAYLDDEFLQLTRGYKKRTSPSTTVPTLHSYLFFARRLLAMILQIPPIDPSTSLRTQYLLRLTGDTLNAIPGYSLPSKLTNGNLALDGRMKEEADVEIQNAQVDGEEPKDYKSALRELLDWLDDLDQAWLAVLQSQVWDPEVGEGVDLVLDVSGESAGEPGEEEMGDLEVDGTQSSTSNKLSSSQVRRNIPKSTPISQTDVTRLRSLLVTSIASLEEWLGRGGRAPEFSSAGSASGEDDVAGMLERLGLLDEFDELFRRTMDFLGGFGGYVVEPESIVDNIEVEMSGCS